MKTLEKVKSANVQMDRYIPRPKWWCIRWCGGGESERSLLGGGEGGVGGRW